MSDNSWIKIFRSINTHWIWQNSEHLKWWLDILIEANHSESKVVIKNEIFICGRGEKLYSLDTWASRWGVNKSKVRRFLELLEKDKMISLKNERKTTRLTICNYESYQDTRNAKETQVKRKRNANETRTTPIEECKEGKEEKEDITPTALDGDTPKSFKKFSKEDFHADVKKHVDKYGKDTCRDFFNYWTEPDAAGKMKFQLQKTWSTSGRLATWLKNESKFGNKPEKPVNTDTKYYGPQYV